MGTARDTDPPRRRAAAAPPAVRRYARERGIDLGELRGTGPGGRITMVDVLGHAAAPARPPSVERHPEGSLRRFLSAQVTRAWSDVPHGHLTVEADVTELVRIRRRRERAGRERAPVLAAFAVKAGVAALKEHPRLNARFDEARGEVVLERRFDVGVTVETPDGLAAPSIRDADRKSIVELAAEIAGLEEKGRGGGVLPGDLQSMTFTVSPPAAGVEIAPQAPLIAPPAVALLAVGPIREEGERHLVSLCLAYDRRAVDDAGAARFMEDVSRRLSDPIELLLG